MNGLRWCAKIVFLLVLLAFYQTRSVAVMAAPAAVLDDPYCGDGICQSDSCNDSQTPGDGCRESRDSCPADCGWCGDGYCDPNYEDWTNCTQDCGSCGDGMCEIGSEADCSLPEHWCVADCGPVQSACESECFFQSDCGTNQICTPQHKCVTYGRPDTIGPKQCGEETGSCSNTSDCCNNGGNGDVCIGADGTKDAHGYCGPPDTGVCPNANACFDAQDCYLGFGCDEFSCYQMYCDPLINRCQFADGPYGLCPDAHNVYRDVPAGPICQAG
jgi:hypothetical protein